MHSSPSRAQIDGATGGAEGHGAVSALVKLITGGGSKGGEGESSQPLCVAARCAHDG